MRVNLEVVDEVLVFSFQEGEKDYSIKCRLDGGEYGDIVAYDPASPLWAEFEEHNQQAFEAVGRERSLTALYWVAEHIGRLIK